MPADIVDAVTAVLVCDGDVFLLRRQPYLAAFPGYDAFPGGKVEPGESEQPHSEPLLQCVPPQFLHALIRELWEELSFDLHAALDVDDVIAITALGAAQSPAFVPKRFNTHFFQIELRRQPAFVLDENEIEQSRWRKPAYWLQAYENGDLLLAPPTLAVLQALAQGVDCRPDLSFPQLRDPERIPQFEAVHGVRHFFVRSNTLPPADRTNCFLLGDDDQKRILVDPSPNGREELERLCQQAGAIGFDEVFLTHHHHDHRQYANEIARRFNVPIGMSADTESRINAREPRFLDGLCIKNYAGNDVITRWHDQALRLHAVPGHDEGQLALMPDGREFCIVGDLIQGIGTVVIAAPEGDMSRYFSTLESIIALNPRVIYPSHGPALGGVFYLQQALKHRREREAQILALCDAGNSLEEMLTKIYKNVDPRLLPLARMNITSHLAKLRSEGAIT